MDQTDSGCGFSIENPFCFTSAEEEFAFVDALRSPDGTRFVQGVKFTCENKRGDLVDHFTGIITSLPCALSAILWLIYHSLFQQYYTKNQP